MAMSCRILAALGVGHVLDTRVGARESGRSVVSLSNAIDADFSVIGGHVIVCAV